MSERSIQRRLLRALVVFLGVVALAAGSLSIFGGVESDGAPPVDCGAPAFVVALGGGRHPVGRRTDCRGAGGYQALGGALVTLVGIAFVFGPRLRRLSLAWVVREAEMEMAAGRWRVSPPWRQLAAASVVLAVGGFLIAAVFDPAWLLAGLISVGPFAAVVILLALRPAIEATPESLKIQNPLRSYVMRWDDIRDVLPGYWGLQIALSDGTIQTAFAVQKSNWSFWRRRHTHADDVAAEILRRARLEQGEDVKEVDPYIFQPNAFIEDPGWRPALPALIPALGMRVAAQRARNHPARGLVIVRQLFLSFALAIGLLAFVLVEIGLQPRDGSLSLSTAIGCVAVVAAVSLVVGPIVERQLDGSEVGKLVESWRTRFFIRIAFGEAPALVGFAGAFLSGRTVPYFVGAAATGLMFTWAAPSARNLARDQNDLDDQGCGLSLAAALASWQPGQPGGE